MSDHPLRVLVTEAIHEVGIELLERHAEVIRLYDRPNETLDQHLPEVDGVIVRTAKITAERLAAAPRLRVVGKHGVGVDNIDVAAATKHGVTVVYTPNTNDESVAEYTVMCFLLLAREVETASRLIRAGEFTTARRRMRGVELRGRTVGVIGLGRIGARVAEICRAGLGMRVLAHDPFVSAERAASLGVELRADLTTLLPECDFVTIHTPLTPATRGMIGATELTLMKPGAYLVNAARGGLVDEAALIEALRSGRLAGAAIDVFTEEPPPVDHPLLALENVIPTPHIAGQTDDSLRRMALLVVEEVLRVLRGEEPRHPVSGDGR